jgi:small-conductance mechanosensitive channel
VGYWIADPENGSLNLKSLINLDILRSLREHNIEIPYPQRVVHTRSAKKYNGRVARAGIIIRKARPYYFMFC